MLPAYGVLWLAGRWYATRYRFALNTLPALGASWLAGVALAEVFSSGGFYFFSSRFADTSLTEFGSRLLMYFPYSLQSFAFWVAIAAALQVAFSLTQFTKRQQT
jgi:membrane-anchored protein YejM (alkaline phosphatase superfamily)